MITVFLVDDHEVTRRGVTRLLADHPDIQVVGEAERVATAQAWIPELEPRVAVLGVHLPDGSGIELCRRLRTLLPELSCVVLAEFCDEQAIVGAVLAGAQGFLGKDARGEQIVHAVREAAAGRSLLDGHAATVLMTRAREDTEAAEATDPLATLTEREREVMGYVGQGLTNREIGRRMFLAEKTVKNKVSELLTKLGMTGRVQLAIFAAKHQLDAPAA